MAPSTLVSQIQRPELAKPGKDSAVKFKEEYDEYSRLIDSYNEGRSAVNQLPKASIRQCIKIDLLENLIMTAIIPGVDDINHLTDQLVTDWQNSVLDKQPINLGDRVSEVVKKHTHVPNPSDPEAGVQEFVFEVMTDLRTIGGTQSMKDSAQAKSVINKLASSLNPEEVRELLFHGKSMWREGQHSNISHFIARASDIATQVQRMNELRPKKTDERPPGKRGGIRRSHSERDEGGRLGEEDRSKRQRRDDSFGRRSEGSTGGSGKMLWNRPCINPRCRGKHKIEDCPITPEDQKQPMLQSYIAEMKEKRKKKLAGKTATKGDKAHEIDVIIGTFEAKARDDTGADTTIIPKSALQAILDSDCPIEVRELAKPIEIELAVQAEGMPKVTVNQQLHAPVTILVPGSRLPVLVRNVKILVSDADMNTILIGRDLLDRLGFSFKKYLSDNYDKIKDNPVTDDTVKCSYAGVRHNDQDDDPIQPDIDLSEQFGDDTPEEIESALRDRVEEAAKNGMYPRGVKRLQSILRTHIRCFGIKLGTSLPAKIEPFEVRLKPDAKPKRAAQRRYGPTQQVFIEQTIRNLERIGAVRKKLNSEMGVACARSPKTGDTTIPFHGGSQGC